MSTPRTWFTAAELAALALPGLPTNRTAFQRHVTAWRTPHTAWNPQANPHGQWRKRQGRGGGYEYHLSLLPLRARRIVMRQTSQPEAVTQPHLLASGPQGIEATPGEMTQNRPMRSRIIGRSGLVNGLKQRDERIVAPPPPRPGRLSAEEQAARHAQAWAKFDSLGEKAKERASFRLHALQGVDDLARCGVGREMAVQIVGDEMGFGKSAFYLWQNRVAGVPRLDRLPYLADYRPGRVQVAPISPDAWELFKSEYLRPEKRSFRECYAMVVRTNAQRTMGWSIPSIKTFRRRLERDIDPRVIVYTREGAEAHDRLYPAQRRDRTCFHAMQALNYDGHRLDVFVRWPGSSEKAGPEKAGPEKAGSEGSQTQSPPIGRAFLIAFQDLYSGKIVGWRLDRSENPHAFRLAFLDAVGRYGFPEIVWSDNTMAAAAKENTGGSRFRHRFKIRADDPVGLFTQFGVDLRFTIPGHGQSKPIESAFSTLSRYIAKAPECAGAYTGNSPTNKPANYGSKAVDLETLVQVCEREIAWFNSRQTDLRQGPAAGRSRDAAFEESYAQALVRKATPEQLRPWMLAMDGVTCRKPDGSVWLHQNRYWHPDLVRLIGKKVSLRFDPDALHAPVHVYRLDGSFVCTADCVQDTGFADQAAGKAHAAAKRAFTRATRKMVESERLLTAQQMAALQPSAPDDPPPPEQRVVGGMFGGVQARKQRPRAQALPRPEIEQAPNLTPNLTPDHAPQQAPDQAAFFGALGAGLRLVQQQHDPLADPFPALPSCVTPPLLPEPSEF